MLYVFFPWLSEMFSPYLKEEEEREIFQAFINFFEQQFINEKIKPIDYQDITEFKVIRDKLVMVIFIKTIRPGVIIGRHGKQFKKLVSHMEKEFN